MPDSLDTSHIDSLVAGNIPATIHDVDSARFMELLIRGFHKQDNFIIYSTISQVFSADIGFVTDDPAPTVRYSCCYQIFHDGQLVWNGEKVGDITQCHAAALVQLDVLIGQSE